MEGKSRFIVMRFQISMVTADVIMSKLYSIFNLIYISRKITLEGLSRYPCPAR